MRNADFHRALGKRITALRKAYELTQAELARQLGVSQQSVFAMELGDRRVALDRVPTLLRVFGVSCEELLGLRPLQPMPKARVSPAEMRLVEHMRELTASNRRVIQRVTAALICPGRAS